MEANELLHAADLRTVPPVDDGISALEADIVGRSKAFCVCSTARDYHVGVADTQELIRRHKDRFVERCNDENPNQIVFVPKRPKNPSEVEEGVERAKRDLARAYEILKRAYPAYVTGKRLLEQPAIRDPFTKAFRQLRTYGVLPATTQNALFNHQGMTLLMEACFATEKDFVRYLRNPGVLTE